jgi:hypothetical protein
MVIRLLQQVTTRKKRALPQSLTRDTPTPGDHQATTPDTNRGTRALGVMLVESLPGELDVVERVQHWRGLAQLVTQRVRVAAERVQRGDLDAVTRLGGAVLEPGRDADADADELGPRFRENIITRMPSTKATSLTPREGEVIATTPPSRGTERR